MREITYPTRITWLTRGEGQIPEAEKKLMIAECQRQIGLLKQSMKFQSLAQGRRVKPLGSYIYECKSVAGLDSVIIRMKRDVGEGEEVGKICWCGCQITPGSVIEAISADTDPTDCRPKGLNYPLCAQTLLGDYAGARYLVRACQKDKWSIFCCISTDFEVFEAGDKVALLFIECFNFTDPAWTIHLCGEDGSAKFACAATARDKSSDLVEQGADGVFVILPYIFANE